MQSSQNTFWTPEKKLGLHNDIADAIVDAQEKGEVAPEDIRTLSNEVLDSLDEVSDEKALMDCLEALIKKWPFLASVKDKYSNGQSDGEAHELLSKLSTYFDATPAAEAAAA